jgi:hypothetical protein
MHRTMYRAHEKRFKSAIDALMHNTPVESLQWSDNTRVHVPCWILESAVNTPVAITRGREPCTCASTNTGTLLKGCLCTVSLVWSRVDVKLVFR